MTTSSSQPEHMMPGGDVSRQQQYITSTTQAPSTMVVGTDMVGDYNTMASAQQQQQQHQHHHQYPVQDHQRQAYYQFSAVSQPYQSPNVNQAAWPSPQAMSTDDFDNGSGANTNYSYRGQAIATAYHPSTLSPRTWPAATQTPPPTSTAQFDLPLRPQEAVYNGLSSHVPMSPDDLRGADLQLHLHYDNGALPHGFEQHNLKSERFHYESSPTADAPGSPYTDSPASFAGEFKTEPDLMPDVGAQMNALPTRAPPPPPKESGSGEEPYAKLIHRALLDAPDHSMSLQELYKWFKDNTDKPLKAEGGGTGWQNSIRHNLSMNKAFERRLQPTFPDIDGGQTGTEKRVSEWYLNPEYIKDIKPTTHFRENNRNSSRSVHSRRNTASAGGGHRRNSPPRSTTATHYQNPDYPSRSMPGRAISGRRGGRATNSARNARRQRSQTGSMSPVQSAAAAAAAAAATQHLQHLQHYPYSPAQLQGLQARADDIRRRNHGGPKRHLEGMANPIVGPMAPPTSLPSNGGVGVGHAGVGTVSFMGPGAPRGPPQAYQLQQFGMADVSGVYTSSAPADDVIYGWGSDAHM